MFFIRIKWANWSLEEIQQRKNPSFQLYKSKNNRYQWENSHWDYLTEDSYYVKWKNVNRVKRAAKDPTASICVKRIDDVTAPPDCCRN